MSSELRLERRCDELQCRLATLELRLHLELQLQEGRNRKRRLDARVRKVRRWITRTNNRSLCTQLFCPLSPMSPLSPLSPVGSGK